MTFTFYRYLLVFYYFDHIITSYDYCGGSPSEGIEVKKREVVDTIKDGPHVLFHLSHPNPTSLGRVRFLPWPETDQRPSVWDLGTLSDGLFSQWHMDRGTRCSVANTIVRLNTTPWKRVRIQTGDVPDFWLVNSDLCTRKTRIHWLGVIFGSCTSESIRRPNRSEECTTVYSSRLLYSW